MAETMTGRTRSSQDPHAARFRKLGDAELADALPILPDPEPEWSAKTAAAYAVYGRSQSARALRAEDYPSVVRLFRYADRLDAWWKNVPMTSTAKGAHESITAIKSLEAMVGSLSASIGLGAKARQALSIGSGPEKYKPGTRLDRFRADGGEDV